MALSGKYDFKGIKEKGGQGIRAALMMSPYTSWLARIPAVSTLASEFLANWLANNGLVVMNIGAYFVNGELDQKALDNAIDSGLLLVEQQGNKLTKEQMEQIDNAVIKAADKALPYNKPIKS